MSLKDPGEMDTDELDFLINKVFINDIYGED